MTIEVVTGWDATHSNLSFAPHSGQPAGYATGSGGIAWDSADWNAHPGAVVIDQDAAASDGTADVLDVETNAATPDECATWVNKARDSFHNVTRKGQREPVIYVNGSNLTAVANDLSHAGISGIGLWLARPGISLSEATSMVQNASGPYPIIGVQYQWDTHYDLDVWNKEWIDNVSGKSNPPPSSGPYRHTVPAGNLATLDDIATDRNWSLDAMVTFSLKYLDAAHTAVLNAYVALDKACVASGNVQRPVAPTGLVYYTVNP